MSTYDDASLILIPSGVKAGKVYSAKPTNGDGDFTFTRASEASRVNSDGLIEKVRTNLITYSEDFSNASWVKSGATFSGDTLTASAGTSSKGIYQLDTTQGVQVNYFDVAYVNHQWVQILVGSGGSDLGYVNFDIQNKAIGTASGVIDASIQDFGTYLRLVYVATTANKTAANIAFIDSGSSSRGAASSSTGAFKLFRSQVEQGLVATDYIATTSVAVSEGSVANLPRLDYSGGATCPSLLLEPQRTNLITYSEDFSNSYWTKTGSSVVGGFTSPEGLGNAYKLVEDTSTGGHYVFSPVILTNDAIPNSVSIFVKSNGRQWIRIQEGYMNINAYFDIENGVLGSTLNVIDTKIEDYGNGWYKCTIIGASYTYASVSVYLAEGDNDITYTGNGTSGVYIYGFQVEEGSYPTSYIPTYGTAATRVADACSKTGISSLIGQTEGTIFADLDLNLASSNIGFYGIQVYDSGFSPTYGKAAYIELYQGKVYGYVRNVTIQCEILSGIYADGQNLKIALAYKENDFALYVNGVQIGVDTSGTLPSTLNSLALHYSAGTQQASPLHQAALFKTRLTNAELETLTTL